MRKFTLLILMTILGSSCLKKEDTLHKSQSMPSDTLHVAIVPVAKSYEQNNAPWISALVIGFLTVITNIIIARINKMAAIKNVEKQAEISTDIAKKQIENSKTIAIENIKNSQILAINQFNSTLKANNRQEWINELRNTLSELLAVCKQMNIEFQDSNKDQSRIKELHEKVTFNRNKILLLLDPDNKDTHKTLFDSLHKFINILDDHLLNSKHDLRDYKNWDFSLEYDTIIENGRKLLYTEWQKIQNYR